MQCSSSFGVLPVKKEFSLSIAARRGSLGVFSGLAGLLPYNIKFSEATTVMIQY